MDWAVKELAGTNLGDARLDERLMTMVADLSERPDSSVPLFSGNWAKTKAARAGHPQVVVIADREADIFELFAAPRDANVSLLVRVRHTQRAVEHEAKRLRPALAQAPSAGQVSITIPRHDDRPTRQAILTIRFAKLVVRPPKDLAGQTPQTVYFILAEEECPPEGVPAIRWILTSTMPVESLEDAARMIG